jgi:ATP-dependent DNA helicase RecG
VTSPLDEPLLKVLGPRSAMAIEKGLRLVTVGDLISHYPRRYERRGELTVIGELPLDENVTIVAEVIGVQERSMQARKGSILEVRITDGKGVLSLTFFNQAFRKQELHTGVRGIFSGKIGVYRNTLQLTHPDYELFDETEQSADDAARRFLEQLVPIYPASATMPSWKLQKSIGLVLDTLPPLADPVPSAIRTRRKLMTYEKAVQSIHRPLTDAEWGGARKALRFQEAFVLQAALLQQRARLRRIASTPRSAGSMLESFDRALPFTLTGEQSAVGREISGDLASGTPMNRLVQGEVGSGKTLVALRAMLAVAESGGQSALLAPTEVLAQQHLRSIVRTLGPDLAARLRPTLVTGQLPVAERRKAMLATVSGAARIVVGTHALLGDKVGFFDLGLVVVDEQHRFGVDQREALRLKGSTPPHVLVLTATPIPRTVAMTVFGDLDISTISELPGGRVPIESFVVWNRILYDRVWHRAAEEIAQGRQVFVVCPAIDAKEVEDDAELEPVDVVTVGDGARGDGTTAPKATPPPIANVTETTAQLRANPVLAGRRIESLHGRMSSEEKDAVMQRFAAGQIDVLVATTVIEVGVDVPNASTMVILDSDRFGVSQLHQLRGRVGRGGIPSVCLFVTHADRESLAFERVEAVASTLDGFELAQKDLELRREGDVLGNTQSGGRSSLRLLRVAKDGVLIGEARELATAVLDVDPELVDYPDLRDALVRRLDAEAESFLSKS